MDLANAREAVEDVLRDWNSRRAKDKQIMLKPVRWEVDTTPEAGRGSAQDAINRQLLDPADLLVAIFRQRPSSPTAGEIERFLEARKPVLLYFSEEQIPISEIDPQQLAGLLEYRKLMKERSLYGTFRDIRELKTSLRDHLETSLEDFSALLIPASKALAYGYFVNFIERAYGMLSLQEIRLPDYGIQLSFSSFHISIAKPISWDNATHNAVVEMGRQLKQIGIATLGTPDTRRAFQIYIRPQLHARLEEAAKSGTTTNLRLEKDETLEVIDFPTPMIAVNDFIKNKEQSLTKPKTDSGIGYWQRQKESQYEHFFNMLHDCIREKSMETGQISFFPYDYKNFKLPS